MSRWPQTEPIESGIDGRIMKHMRIKNIYEYNQKYSLHSHTVIQKHKASIPLLILNPTATVTPTLL